MKRETRNTKPLLPILSAIRDLYSLNTFVCSYKFMEKDRKILTQQIKFTIY